MFIATSVLTTSPPHLFYLIRVIYLQYISAGRKTDTSFKMHITLVKIIHITLYFIPTASSVSLLSTAKNRCNLSLKNIESTFCYVSKVIFYQKMLRTVMYCTLQEKSNSFFALFRER